MRTLLIILSFLCPILGVLVYFIRKDKENDPGVYLGAAAAGFVLNIILLCV